jgi:hypothetical protein
MHRKRGTERRQVKTSLFNLGPSNKKVINKEDSRMVEKEAREEERFISVGSA